MEEALKNHLETLNIESNVVTLLTMVEVDKDDPAFKTQQNQLVYSLMRPKRNV